MDNLWTEDLNISYLTMLIVFLITIGLFWPVIKRTENIIKKVFIIFLMISYFIYSGIGISVLEDKLTYTFYYIIYTIVLVFSLYIFRSKGFNMSITDTEIGDLIDKYKLKIIFLYTTLYLILLIFPENKLYLLLSPPSLDISNVMEMVVGEKKSDGFTSIITLLTNILMPFFYIALIRYKDKPLLLLFYILVPTYIIFCKDAYISRTVIVLNSLFYVSTLYYFNEHLRKKIIIIGSVVSFFSIFFLAAFTSIRSGDTVSNMSFGDALKSLFIIEGTFPSLFEDIYLNTIHGVTYGFEYITWLITQPLPGFLKSGFVDFNLNQQISKILLGVDNNDTVSFVLLTGLVSESVFIFGRSLFFIHAIIFGFIVNIFLNLVTSRENFKILALYSLLFTGLAIGRSGTSATGVYPFMIKTIVYLPLILFLLNFKKTYK